MISWKRIVLESILFAGACCGVYILFQIVQGMILTYTYVPDIVSQYEHVEYLQSQVAIGTIQREGDWRFAWQGVAIFLGLGVLYGGVRYAIAQKKR